MSFAAPLWLLAAGVVAAGLVVAHMFSTSVPPREILPTVRFVPSGAPLAVLRTRRITDAGLLVLRLLIVALLGLALAGAHVPRSEPARIVIVDASRAVKADAETRSELDTLMSKLQPGAVFIMMDSAAAAAGVQAVGAMQLSHAKGSLSAGLAAAHRAITGVTTGRGEIELVIVSPAVREQIDSATAPLLALWEGPIRIVRTRVAAAPAPGEFEVRSAGDDPIAAVLATASQRSEQAGAPFVRVVRESPTRSDSVWASDSGRVLVLWPSAAPAGAPAAAADSIAAARQAAAHTVHGFATERHTVVGTFARVSVPESGEVIARWIDGEPAATEVRHGAGCIRHVAVPVDPVGDLALRDSFRAFASSMVEPCGGARDFTPVPDSVLLPAERPALAADVPVSAASRLPLIFAVLAMVGLVAEQWLRRRMRAAP